MEKAVANKRIRLSRKTSPRVLDLFSGCGGLSLGFARAGYQILGGLDIDANASATFAANLFRFTDSSTIAARSSPHDVTQLTPTQALHALEIKEPVETAVDVLLGSPPCQALSLVGRAKRRSLQTADHSVERFRDLLIYAKALKPLMVLLENVPQFINYKGRNLAAETRRELEKMGYHCDCKILNTAHYGVPQLRERLFLVGLMAPATPDFPLPTHRAKIPKGYWHTRSQSPGNGPTAVTVAQAIGDFPAIGNTPNNQANRYTQALEEAHPFAQEMRTWDGFQAYSFMDDHRVRNYSKHAALFAQMAPGDQYPQALAIAQRLLAQQQNPPPVPTLPPYDKFHGKWRKLSLERPSHTLTAHLGRDGFSHLHPEQARTISIREAARLQSFPDGFRLPSSMNHALRLLGNAVPPLLAYRLALHFLPQLRAL